MSRAAARLFQRGRRLGLYTASTAQCSNNGSQLATLRCYRLNSNSTSTTTSLLQDLAPSAIPPVPASSEERKSVVEQQSRTLSASKQPPSCPDRLLQSVELVCQGNEKAVLASYAKFIEMTCENLALQKLPIEFMTDTRQRMTLLKSAFKYKDHRVQYEMRTYAFKLVLLRLTGSTADTFVEYVQRMCPENIAMKVTEFELQKLPLAVQNFLEDTRKKRRSVKAGPQQTKPEQ